MALIFSTHFPSAKSQSLDPTSDCKVDWQINIHELHVPKKRKMDPGVQLAISTTLAKDQISVFDQVASSKKRFQKSD